MPIELGLWRLGDRLHPVEFTRMNSENRLETVLADDITVVDPDLLLIGRQVPTAFGKFIDLLALDSVGQVVVIELKKGKTPREVVAQLLDYVSRDDAVFGFAPESTGALPGRRDDRFDILISTDVLAEGMNLQQCRNIINFDLPWNPMRLVQRHGRIDRIACKHRDVYLRTYFPDTQLDLLLDLEQRVRVKLARAAASVGVEAAPIERGAEGRQTFSETREEIERLARNNPGIFEQGGTDSAAQSGEEHRQELRKALERDRDQIVNLPWKAGSGMIKGSQRGHFFCARLGERVYLRFVPAGADKAPIVDELGTCLRLIECAQDTPRNVPQDLKQSAFSAWRLARQSIHNAWMFETDPANLHPRVPRLNRAIAEFLRRHPSPEVEQADLDRALDAIEAPCSKREQNLLREVFDAEHASNVDKARALIEEIARIGLEPYRPPCPLPPADIDQIHLVCWMAIESAGPV